MAEAGKQTAGLDIGQDTVWAVVLDGRTGQVLRAQRAQRTGGDLPGTLARLRDELALKGMPIAVTAESDLVVTRTRLPFTDRRRLREVAAYHVEDQLPFDVSDWVTDHLVIAEGEEGAELMVFAQRRPVVSGLLDDLLEAGLYPDRLLPRPLAVARAAAGQVGGDESFACLWAGRRNLSIAIVRGDSPLLARSVPLGVAGAGALGAEGVVDLALREVRASLWTAGVELSGCPILVGAEDDAGEGISRRLAEALGPAAQELRPEATQQGDAEMEYVPAAGAARALAEGVELDLAHAVRSTGHLLRAVRRPLTAFLAAVLLAGAALLAHVGRRAVQASDVLEHNQQALEQTWRALYPDEPLPPDPMLRVESDLRAKSSGARPTEGPEPVEALARLDRVMDALPPDSVDVRGFRVEAGQVTLNCSADNLGAADEVVAALQQQVAAAVTARNPMSPAQGTYTFEINVQWRERGTGEADI